MTETAPSWFTEALDVKKTEHRISVEGASVYYQKWGDDKKPGIVLVHGSGSHSHWWDFIAPQLIKNFQVSALDLSGMGDSDRRDSYEASQFGREIISVANDSGFFDSRPMAPVICGHSLGAAMATIMASRCKHNIELNDPIELYTFGSPRVGWKGYCNSLNIVHHRWKNNNDIVTTVPLAIMGYVHHGEEHYLNAYGKYRQPTGWQMFKDRWRGMWMGIKKGKIDNFGDHSMVEYIKHISSLD